MPEQPYTDDELARYFQDPNARRKAASRPTDAEARHRALRLVKWIAGGVAAVILLGVLYLGYLSTTLPPTELIENPEHLETTVVYTADGVELARYYLGQNRTWVTGAEIAPTVKEALVAMEDRRFYDHWGVDARGFAAVAAGLLRGERIRGASTITMQLARNLYEQIGTERTALRKLREILTAIQLERRYTKEEILEMYLNTVPFRYNAFGIEAAARTFFNKPAAELDVPEAATLVAMLAATTRYDPVRNPENSHRRRNLVMAEMAELGYLEPARYEELKDQPTQLDFTPYSHTDNLAPHFAEILRKDLEVWAEEQGYNLYTDGLVVHTTIDSRLQKLAQAAVTEQGEKLQTVVDVEWSARSPFRDHSSNGEDAYVEYARSRDIKPWAYFWESQTRLVDSFIRNTDRYRALRQAENLDAGEAIARLRQDAAFMDSLKAEKTRLEAGFVAIEPQTGYVRAWVGGRDYVEDKFDHVRTARRQSGSTFKPFVYIAAVDNGYSPYYRLMDSTFVWRQEGLPPWVPRNSGGTSGEYVTLRTALSQSKNIPTARLTREVGPATVATYARRLGIESPMEAVPSIGLGVADVTLLEMTAAYATLAAGGVYHEPMMVTRIEDRQGNVIADFVPQGREALSASTAYTVTDMMRAVVDEGTGQRIRWKFGLRDYDFAGKTGTTQESADGWFILMHPDLVTGAWVGWNDRRVAFRTSWWGQGAHNALHIVGDFTRRVVNSDEPGVGLSQRQFQPPSGYVVPSVPAQDLGDRPARDLLERWEERERERDERRTPQKENEERRGRIGW